MATLPVGEGEGEQRVAGFATLYRFFAWPDGVRLRLSQLLVMPPLQRRGVAAALLVATRAAAVAAASVDWTVEDPTDILQHAREAADVRAARAMPPVVAAAAAAVAACAVAADAPSRVAALACPRTAAQQLRAELRICRPQVRLVWEALLLLAARDARMDPRGPAAAAFRDLVALRLKGSGDASKAVWTQL